MQPGRIIDGRYRIETLAGTGGMGVVYRATDLERDAAAAVKVLHRVAAHSQRFDREARLLARLRHPHIVDYLGHGRTADGEPYLAMEWLEGEELTDRIARGPLSVEETLVVGRAVAGALAAAHAESIVHRDVKPSNVFLTDGDLTRAKLIDFGVAHVQTLGESLTGTGTVLGSPGYLAPEQARGSGNIDARTDVFALGCILFECLTGRPTFVGEHPIALLAAVLLEQAPAVREFAPDVPMAIDAIVTRMLSKDADLRPRDGADVLEILERAHEVSNQMMAPAERRSLSGSELRLLTVILSRPPGDVEDTIDEAGAEELVNRVHGIAEAHGADLEVVATGSLVLTLLGTGSATDQARAATRCAISLGELIPGIRLAVAMGRGLVDARIPIGAVVDRAADVLSTSEGPGVVVDDATANLISGRFETEKRDRGHRVLGEVGGEPGAPTLLGQPVRCVGRRKEIAFLTGLAEESLEDEVARAAMVIAPSGMGKSALCREVAVRIQTSWPEARVLRAGGDPMTREAAFSVVGHLVRHFLQLREATPSSERRDAIERGLVGLVDADDLKRFAAFVGEIVLTPFPKEYCDSLDAARSDPTSMRDQIRGVWEDLLERLTRNAPLVAFVEDFHWADRASHALLDAAMRRLSSRRFLLIVTARPEVDEAFPEMLPSANVHRITLDALTPRACERLVQRYLDGISGERVEAIVDVAQGNPLFLEELIRAEAAGTADEAAETVATLVQARFDAMPAAARATLRVASVFGGRFWQGAVVSMLREHFSSHEIDDALTTVEHLEIVSRRETARFPGEREWSFRHATFRDAAYETLPHEDRELAHWLAATWLAKMGEPEGAVLAEHYERGLDLDEAAASWLVAAQQARDGGDLEGVVRAASRAADCGAAGSLLGRARLLEADALRWHGDNAEAERAALEATNLLEEGSGEWAMAASTVAAARLRLGDHAGLVEMAERVESVATVAEPTIELAVSLARIAVGLPFAGQLELAERLSGIFKVLADDLEESFLLSPWLHNLRASAALHSGDLAGLMSHQSRAAEEFAMVGDHRRAVGLAGGLAYASMELGAYEAAEKALRETIGTAGRMQLSSVVTAAKHNLGLTLAYLGELKEAERLESEALEEARGNDQMTAACRIYLAMILTMSERVVDAAAVAEEAVQLASGRFPPLEAYALAVQSRVQLRLGASGPALAAATRAAELLDSLGGVDSGESLIRLSHVEALASSGDAAGARVAAEAARASVMRRADRISDEELRRGFLAKVGANQRLLELATRLTSSELDHAIQIGDGESQ